MLWVIQKAIKNYGAVFQVLGNYQDRGSQVCTFEFLNTQGYLLALADFDSIRPMKAKHANTLLAIFASPTRASIAFAEIETLLIKLGAEKTEREGSRIKFTLRGVEWHAHRPHPGKEAKKYQVEQVREFLTRLEITP